MWLCLDSERMRSRLRPVGFALASLALLAGPALGRDVKRVHVDRHGVVIETDSSGTADFDTASGGMVTIDETGSGIVRVFGDIDVPAGRRVSGDVVAVFGSVRVAGRVDGTVVAVLGSVHLDENAVVDGDAVAVGGRLDQAEGATVNGQSVSLSFFPVPWGVPAVPVLLGAVFMGWLVTLFAGWVFVGLFPQRLVRVATTASQRTVASFFVGLASIPGFFLLLVLLFVTVIGIPLACLLPIAYTVLQYAGQIAATYVLGCRLTNRPVSGPRRFVPIVAGSLLVAAFFAVGVVLLVVPGMARPAALFFGLLGVLLVLGLTQIGTGAFLLSRFGGAPKGALGGAAPMAPDLVAPPASGA